MRKIFVPWVFIVSTIVGLPATGQLVDSEKSVEAYLTGSDYEMCQGDSVRAYLTILGGSKPWDVVINDKEGEYLSLEKISSQSTTIWLKPVENDSFYIASVVDKDSIPGRGIGVIGVKVLPTNPVEIVLERTAYLKT